MPHQDLLAAEECKKEVFYFEKMEADDYRNDVLLAEACRLDVDKFCKNVKPGACRGGREGQGSGRGPTWATPGCWC